jgi:hypothetical protein
VNLLSAGATYRVATIGRYIGSQLWPFIQRAAGATTDTPRELPSWEAHVAAQRRRRITLIFAPLTNGPATILFGAASIVALVVVGKYAGAPPTNQAARDHNLELWLGGWALAVLAVAIPLLVGLRIRAQSKKSFGEDAPQPVVENESGE